MESVISTLREEIESVNQYLSIKDKVREELIRLSRDIIRLSGDVISLIHQHKISAAEELLVKLKEIVEQYVKLIEEHVEFKFSGITNNCLSEYVEAIVLYNIIKHKRLPRISELKVPIVPYILGIADCVGELRRYCLDLIMKGNLSQINEILSHFL